MYAWCIYCLKYVWVEPADEIYCVCPSCGSLIRLWDDGDDDDE